MKADLKLKIQKVSIDKNTSILETLKRMDKEDKNSNSNFGP